MEFKLRERVIFRDKIYKVRATYLSGEQQQILLKLKDGEYWIPVTNIYLKPCPPKESNRELKQRIKELESQPVVCVDVEERVRATVEARTSELQNHVKELEVEVLERRNDNHRLVDEYTVLMQQLINNNEEARQAFEEKNKELHYKNNKWLEIDRKCEAQETTIKTLAKQLTESAEAVLIVEALEKMPDNRALAKNKHGLYSITPSFINEAKMEREPDINEANSFIWQSIKGTLITAGLLPEMEREPDV